MLEPVASPNEGSNNDRSLEMKNKLYKNTMAASKAKKAHAGRQTGSHIKRMALHLTVVIPKGSAGDILHAYHGGRFSGAGEKRPVWRDFSAR